MTILYSGIWTQELNEHQVFTNASLDNFKSRWRQNQKSGLNLESLDVAASENGLRWAGVFARNKDVGTDFQADLTLNDLKKTNKRKGQVMRCLTSYRSGSDTLYAASWMSGDESWCVDGDLTQEEFVTQIRERRANKEYLFDFQTNMTPAGRRWTGLWRTVADAGFEDRVWLDGDRKYLIAKNLTFRQQGLRPTRLRSYRANGRTRFVAVWHKSSESRLLFTDMNFNELRERKQSLDNQMQLTDLDARSISVSEDGSQDGTAGDTVRIHIRFAQRPPQSIDKLAQLAKDVFATRARINVTVASIDELPSSFRYVQLNKCQGRTSLSPQQSALLNMREGFAPNDIGVYLAGTLSDSIGLLRGCATEQLGGIILNATGMSHWTMAHEIGHILGLHHVPSDRNLMYRNTDSIVMASSTPELTQDQIGIAKKSRFVLRS